MSRTQASAGRSQTYFGELIDAATANLVGDEVLLANIAGEHTDFIRLNNNDVRQAGTIEQSRLSVDLIEGRRHVGGSLQLTGEHQMDDARIAGLLSTLREQRALVADDPYLLYNTEPQSSERIETGAPLEPAEALGEIGGGGGRWLEGGRSGSRPGRHLRRG